MGGPGGTTGLSHELLRRKPVGSHKGEHVAGGDLQRSIGTFQLTMFGVGATIGTGIFFVMSAAVPEAGPAVVLAFVMAGIAAGLAALCYAEMASSVPVSGSTYSYAYATLGEIVAMGVAACLLLEYGVSTAAVAVGWSGYLNEAIRNISGIELPHAILAAPWDADPGVVNLPAVVLVALCTLLLIRGASESARVNAIMVVIKLTVLAMFIVIALTAFDGDHFAQFAPYGVAGVATAAGTIFFSFIGLDAVSTAGDEVKDPQRTMPRALIAALLIVTTFYVLVAVAAVGTQPWQDFEGQTEAGLARILEVVTGNTVWGTILALGAVISIFSVTLVTLYGQTRILFAMGRDGMLPQMFARVNPRTQTGAEHDHRGDRGGAAGGPRAVGLPHRRRVDRHPHRVRRGLARRDHPAVPGAEPAPRLQGARLPGHADPVHPGLRLHPGKPALVHVVDLRGLGGGLPDLLPAVWA
jgi:APA family basic amino acid/polyamine antiporter